MYTTPAVHRPALADRGGTFVPIAYMRGRLRTDLRGKERRYGDCERRPRRPRAGGVGDPLGRHRDGRRIRPRRCAAHAHRRSRRDLRRRGPHDRLEQHRRAGPRAREAAAAGTDQARDLLVLHLEPGGSGGRQRGRDRGDAHAAGDLRGGDSRSGRRDRRLPHAGRCRNAARGRQGGAHRGRRASCTREAASRRRRTRVRSSRRPARQSLVPTHRSQLQSVDGDGRAGDNRGGGRACSGG